MQQLSEDKKQQLEAYQRLEKQQEIQHKNIEQLTEEKTHVSKSLIFERFVFDV